jgi:hypothetical protein
LDTDVLVIGIQDVYKISASNFMGLDSTMKEICERWEEVLLNYMKVAAPDFKKVQSSYYEDVFMIVFAKSSVYNSINDIKVDGICFSAMKKLSKKGAVVIKMSINDTPIVFINAHLTSDVDSIGNIPYPLI